jgi:hypothetical protein
MFMKVKPEMRKLLEKKFDNDKDWNSSNTSVLKNAARLNLGIFD